MKFNVIKAKAWVLDLSMIALNILLTWYQWYNAELTENEILWVGFQRSLISIAAAFIATSLMWNSHIPTLGSIWWNSKVKSETKMMTRFSFARWQAGLLFILIFVTGLKIVHFSIYELLDRDGFEGAQRLFSGMAKPKVEIFPKAVVQMVQTVFMAFMATLMAAPVAFVLSFLAARNVMNRPWTKVVRHGLRFLLNLVSSVESLIWAIIFSVWVGIGPFAGVLALTIHSMVSLARGFSELIEVSDLGPVEGIRSTGANQIQVVWFGILPQVFLPFLSYTIYRWDINIRMATVVGLVGGGGIGTLMIQNLGQGLWHELGAIILVIALTVWILDFISSSLREILK